ncbi:exporter of the RND superfamily protein-like protein [Chloroherpeton thalassium ATCC 35110]|uniref:Exporter of the RND superfamily protein-like protein n=1 Tax=Chloroherpeton thalassium (strain ATCC 35110 / GB-78) TaxID=517418 RepID=B3QRV8_CHLT3|nr:MMPL family transporter [Chloroherpeton thalassium]ACF13911.1 exporter of the RND superfamily protein-like protein [Chloroherpeton thalassium ATCC 35110]
MKNTDAAQEAVSVEIEGFSLPSFRQRISESATTRLLVQKCEENAPSVSAQGVYGSLAAILTALMFETLRRPVLLVCNEERVDLFENDLRQLAGAKDVCDFVSEPSLTLATLVADPQKITVASTLELQKKVLPKKEALEKQVRLSENEPFGYETPDKEVVSEPEKILKAHPGNETVMLGGSPYLRVQNGMSMKNDIKKLLPLGILFMLIFLFISFRQFRGVWLPTLVVIISIIISLGFIPLLGWDFTIVTIILPVLLIAVANDYGIHMFSHYQDDNSPGNKFSKEDISRRMATSLGKPILISGLTTMAGLLCMLGHILIPAWQMGILAAIGIAAALLCQFSVSSSAQFVASQTQPDFNAGQHGRKREHFGQIVAVHR